MHVAICSFFNRWDKSVAAAAKSAPQVPGSGDSKSGGSAAAAASGVDPIVSQVIGIERKESPVLSDTFDLNKFNASFLARHEKSAPHRLAAARVSIELNPSAKSEAVKLVSSIDQTSTIPVSAHVPVLMFC